MNSPFTIALGLAVSVLSIVGLSASQAPEYCPISEESTGQMCAKPSNGCLCILAITTTLETYSPCRGCSYSTIGDYNCALPGGGSSSTPFNQSGRLICGKTAYFTLDCPCNLSTYTPVKIVCGSCP